MRWRTWFVLAAALAMVGPAFPSEASPRRPPAPAPAQETSPDAPPDAAPPDAAPTRARTLVYGTATQAGLVPAHVARIAPDVAAGLLPSPDRPLYPGAVVLAARNGVIVEHAAVGEVLRYAGSDGAELPPDARIPARTDTIFDVASLSKLFTAVVAMQQVERHRLDLDAPVARYLPAFAAAGKENVTVRHLMTHTAGLPAGLGLDPYPTVEERMAAIYSVPLRSAPGSTYLYSDLSFIVLGKIVEKVTGEPLDRVVHAGIVAPLGLRDTMYNPPAASRSRIAPTEWQEGGRGLVWGEVHDRTSWLLGGTAGHAGVFSTAHDLAVFAQTMVNDGAYGTTRILTPTSVQAMRTNHNAPLGPGSERGLGFQLAQYSYMGAMRTPATFGHTGFTGTSLVIDPATRSFVVLLSNKVHPTRAWSDLAAARRTVAGDLARAVPVHPVGGTWAWFADQADPGDARLTLPLPDLEGPSRLRFAYWWDTEPDTDHAVVEVSSDGDTWAPLPLRLRAGDDAGTSDGTVTGYQGRRWFTAEAVLPAGTTHLRWRYHTNELYTGRGVYVDTVRIENAGRLVFDDRRPADDARWQADGFVRSAD